jgi:hypothetical protein
MAWVRIHDGAMQNIKIASLSDAAFRLWVCGLCYCQTALTDGLIPREAVAQLRAKPAALKELLTTKLPGRAPLWEPHEHGYQVHDYLEWNNSRGFVTEKRTTAKQRAADARARKALSTDERAPHVRDTFAIRAPDPIPSLSRDSVLSTLGIGESKKSSFDLEKGSGEKPSAPTIGLETDEVAERGAWLVRRYEALFQEYRNGAKYRPRPNLDWHDACDLVKHWDNHRLEKLAILVLTTTDPWISRTDRSFKIFGIKASWADDKLTQWEAEHGAMAV